MLTSLDVLYLALAFAIIATAILINLILYNLYRSIRSVRKTTETALNFTYSVIRIKHQTKVKILKTLRRLITRFK